MMDNTWWRRFIRRPTWGRWRWGGLLRQGGYAWVRNRDPVWTRGWSVLRFVNVCLFTYRFVVYCRFCCLCCGFPSSFVVVLCSYVPHSCLCIDGVIDCLGQGWDSTLRTDETARFLGKSQEEAQWENSRFGKKYWDLACKSESVSLVED